MTGVTRFTQSHSIAPNVFFDKTENIDFIANPFAFAHHPHPCGFSQKRSKGFDYLISEKSQMKGFDLIFNESSSVLTRKNHNRVHICSELSQIDSHPAIVYGLHSFQFGGPILCKPSETLSKQMILKNIPHPPHTEFNLTPLLSCKGATPQRENIFVI